MLEEFVAQSCHAGCRRAAGGVDAFF